MDKIKLQQNIANVHKRIEQAALRSGRDPGEVKLIAVSKTVDIDTAKMANELGLCDFGENRVQELKKKSDALPDARWHMIGRLQTNKVKDVVGRAVLIHSMDRWSLAEELNKRGVFLGIEVPVLLEVNVAGEEQKAGIAPVDVEPFLQELGQLSNIRLYGFMTMAPFTDQAEQTRPVFRDLYELRKRLAAKTFANVELRYLSMGMSNDFEVAVEEGADFIRVGTALFT